MVGCASGSKTHMNIQSKEEALYLTAKKLIISAQSNSWFLSTITGELFLLASLATRSFPKTIFISFCRFRIRCLPSWESFFICDKFGSMLSLSVSILSKKVFNSALSSNYFWFPVNFSCTTSLCNLLLCSICFPLSSNFFLKKIFKHGKDLINGC